MHICIEQIKMYTNNSVDEQDSDKISFSRKEFYGCLDTCKALNSIVLWEFFFYETFYQAHIFSFFYFINLPMMFPVIWTLIKDITPFG